MTTHLVVFENIEWESPAIGVRYKKFVNVNQQIRLVEFSEGFIETNWCEKEHAGYVLEGSCSIAFPDYVEQFKSGDVLFLQKGSEHQHKVVIGKGEKVLLLLFESTHSDS